MHVPASVAPLAHTDPKGQKYPAAQLPEHAAVVSVVAEPKVPAGHSVHCILVSLYDPAVQDIAASTHAANNRAESSCRKERAIDMRENFYLRPVTRRRVMLRIRERIYVHSV